MSGIRTTGGLVIKCFKSVEYCADRLTGAAGPVFVTICWFLIGLGGLVFFDVLIVNQPFSLLRLILTPPALLIAANLYAQYWYATRTSPGDPRTILDEVRKDASWMIDPAEGRRVDPEEKLRDGWWGGEKISKCGKCFGPKPISMQELRPGDGSPLSLEGINQCVGLYNQRYFVLFMFWLSISCWSVVGAGWGMFWVSMSHRPNWPGYTPPIAFTLIYILSGAIGRSITTKLDLHHELIPPRFRSVGLAVPVLMFWHLYLVARGETSIEGHDNDYFAKKAKERGMMYVNPYDMGRKTNLEMFFNVGEGRLPYHTLLLPYRFPPYTSGYRFPLHPIALQRRRNELRGQSEAVSERQVVVGDEDEGELTDDEDGGGGVWREEGDDRWT